MNIFANATNRCIPFLCFPTLYLFSSAVALVGISSVVSQIRPIIIVDDGTQNRTLSKCAGVLTTPAVHTLLLITDTPSVHPATAASGLFP